MADGPRTGPPMPTGWPWAAHAVAHLPPIAPVLHYRRRTAALADLVAGAALLSHDPHARLPSADLGMRPIQARSR